MVFALNRRSMRGGEAGRRISSNMPLNSSLESPSSSFSTPAPVSKEPSLTSSVKALPRREDNKDPFGGLKFGLLYVPRCKGYPEDEVGCARIFNKPGGGACTKLIGFDCKEGAGRPPLEKDRESWLVASSFTENFPDPNPRPGTVVVGSKAGMAGSSGGVVGVEVASDSSFPCIAEVGIEDLFPASPPFTVPCSSVTELASSCLSTKAAWPVFRVATVFQDLGLDGNGKEDGLCSKTAGGSMDSRFSVRDAARFSAERVSSIFAWFVEGEVL
mmetsp:Transcript_4831/g.5301  ORF Transcript_4831/g.5301 Transcript_4831/m.5301 type:complete len:272 (-) Transcript_4831:4031-4846(-)